MEGTPYRAMPIPPGPPREWRSIIRRGLAAFDALVLVLLATGRALRAMGSCTAFQNEYARFALKQPIFFAVPALLALVGLFGHGQHRLRGLFLIMSGSLSLFAGATIPMGLWAQRLYISGYRDQTAMYGPGPLALLVVFVAVGVITIESGIARTRRG